MIHHVHVVKHCWPELSQDNLAQANAGQTDLAQVFPGQPDLAQVFPGQPDLAQVFPGQPDLAQGYSRSARSGSESLLKLFRSQYMEFPSINRTNKHRELEHIKLA